jgi:uncharacterized protein (TIGR02145 family)
MVLMVAICAVGAFAAPRKGSMTDPRDGKTYKTVKIGSQTWMAENLNYKTKNSYCHEDEEPNCARYGRLYEWDAAIKACPAGWHLPSKEEFETLFRTVGGTREEDEDGDVFIRYSEAGKKLKSTYGWGGYLESDDSFGFSALPAGVMGDRGVVFEEGNFAYFWSSTEYARYEAYAMYLSCHGDEANLSDDSIKLFGYSVRCVKNK